MSKKRAQLTMVLMAALLAVLLFTAFKGWDKAGTGSVKNIKLGLALSGGVSITYQTVDENPSAEDMADTIYKLQQRVDNYSTEASVYQEGNNRINIEIPGVSNADEILAELGKPGSLVFQLADGTVVLDGSHVVSAEADKGAMIKAPIISVRLSKTDIIFLHIILSPFIKGCVTPSALRPGIQRNIPPKIFGQALRRRFRPCRCRQRPRQPH